MKRVLLSIISLGTVLFVFAELAMGLNKVLAAKKEIMPIFQSSDSAVSGEAETSTAGLLLPVEVTLPYGVDGTSLIAEKIVSYDGPFLEDGTNHEVVNVMGLLLRNAGDVGIERAEIVLTGDRQRFIFEADIIPPGATVLVLEKNRTFYGCKNFSSCSGWQITDNCGWSNWGLDIEETGMGTLEVTNQTGRKIQQARLHYKTYLEGILVGGITHVYTIESLQPGESILISPARYAKGYSRIIRVELKN